MAFYMAVCATAYGKKQVSELPPKTFNALLKISPKAVIVDVQTAEQFVKVHLVGALPAPEKTDLAKVTKKPPRKHQNIYLLPRRKPLFRGRQTIN